MPLDVHSHSSDLHDIRQQLHILTPTQDCPDPSNQLTVTEGLGHIVIGSELKSDNLVHLRFAGGDHDYRHRTPEPQLPADFRTGHTGHHQVEQDQIGADPVVLCEALGSVICDDNLEPLLSQHVGQCLGVGLFILDDQYSRHIMLYRLAIRSSYASDFSKSFSPC